LGGDLKNLRTVKQEHYGNWAPILLRVLTFTNKVKIFEIMEKVLTAKSAGTITIGGDLEVNRFGYGAMRITGDGVWGPPKDKSQALKVLKKAIDLGINFIDTADSYGPYISEELIAEALYPYPFDLVIATKGGLERTGPNQWPINGKPEHLKFALEGSLKRLKLERIDLYQLHRFDPNVPIGESLGFLKEMQTKGLIRHIGISEVSVEEIETAGQYIKVESVQNMYNLTERKWEKSLEWCERNGIAFLPWFPLAGGNIEADKMLKKFETKYNANSYQIALSWLLNHSKAILPIAGTSSPEHLEENLGALDIHLSKEDLQALDQLT
jgi:aryl-alcohol dehydrogenase-like predicted oxidoreductase